MVNWLVVVKSLNVTTWRYFVSGGVTATAELSPLCAFGIDINAACAVYIGGMMNLFIDQGSHFQRRTIYDIVCYSDW